MYVAIATAGGLEDIKLNMTKRKGKDIVQELVKFKELEKKGTKEEIKKFEQDVTQGLMSRTSEEE
jgi:hypothetical protein